MSGRSGRNSRGRRGAKRSGLGRPPPRHCRRRATTWPGQGERPNPAGPASVAGVRYRRVVLGFVVEGTRSRWLTDDEISAGVVRALESGEDRTLVGVLEPRAMRP